MRLVSAAVALAALSLSAPAFGLQSIDIPLRPGEALLRVKADGEARTRPDLMEITAGVVTTGETARAALAANTVLADRLIAAVRANGIEARDVQTSDLSVSPRFDRADEASADREDRPPRILGYVARNQLSLRLRDLARAPEVVNSLFEAGANEVRGPSFGLTNAAPAEASARQAAVVAAQAEALAYAEAFGMRIARVLRVSQRGAFDTEDDAIIVTGSRVRTPVLEPGEVRTAVTIWVDYAMVPK